MMLRSAAALAIAFGFFLAIAEAVRNWGDWQWWPFWVVDYIAAVLLVAGGLMAWKRGHRVWLAGGWGFTAAMFYMSFFSHLSEAEARRGDTYASGTLTESNLTLIIGIMTAVAFLGFVLTLFARTRDT
jgi:hypothetical protein